MTPLLKKEIRLLLPAWALTLLLAVVPTFLFRSGRLGWNEFDHFAPVLFGIILLCASSFGREFSLGTFSGLLVQPCPRKQFWFLKVGVLLGALISVLATYVFCAGAFHVTSVADDNPSLLMVGLFLLSAISGGLWLALWLRQMMAVVWLMVLVPFLLYLPCLLILSHFEASDKTVDATLDAVLLVYALAGVTASWFIFRRAQDAPWSGGTIVLPDWMSTPIALPTARAQKPRPTSLWSLARKEFHFNQVPLLGMGVLCLLEAGVIGLRYSHLHTTDVFWRDLNSALEAFGSLWVIAPLVIGCTCVAEERKLGTLEGQLCQPVSIVRQFLVKLFFTLVVGGLLSSFLLLLGEGIGQMLGLTAFNAGVVFVTAGGMFGIALIAFFASSFTKNLLQALPAAVATVLGIQWIRYLFLVNSGFRYFPPHHILWNPVLPDFILVAVLTVVLPWLAYRNFRSLPEISRIWRRTGLALAAVVLFTAASSAAIYNRIWEIFTPFEPAHGPALWTQSHAPVALPTGFGNNLLFYLPDGRCWYGWLGDRPPGPSTNSGSASWPEELPLTSLKCGQFLTGSNWSSLSIGVLDIQLPRDKHADSQPGHPVVYDHWSENLDTIGIQANGTLWVSEWVDQPNRDVQLRPWNTNALVQFGEETNWQELAIGRDSSVLLLKTDGTLWRWAEASNAVASVAARREGLRAFTPVQIGTNADWQRFVAGGSFARKKDGSVWNIRFNSKTGLAEIKPNTKFKPSTLKPENLKQAEGYGFIRYAGIHPDGTLWISLSGPSRVGARIVPPWHDLEVGRETNWVKVAMGFKSAMSAVVALRNDGTLWEFDDGGGLLSREMRDFAPAPQRLGINHDWVDLARCNEGVVSVAADGSLWFWRNDMGFLTPGRQGAMLKQSERPIPLGNIMAANQTTP